MAELFHGGSLDAVINQFGGKKDEWLDLSTGINPNAYPAGELDHVIWQRLPDKSAEANLLNTARNYYQVTEDKELVAAPGTQAIIELLPQIINARQVRILSPTYDEHAYCWKKAGSDVLLVDGLDKLHSCDLAVVVNPNNPTAEFKPAKLLKTVAEGVETLIVDEAFCDPFQENSIVPDLPDNVVVLKSFGKFFGLAGLRLGFAICHSTLGEAIRSRLGPWAISGPALKIGARAFADKKWISKTCGRLVVQSKKLADILRTYGFDIEGVHPLFIYVKCDDSGRTYNHLCEHHILVRQFPDYDGFLRFGMCKNNAELERLQKALKSYG